VSDTPGGKPPRPPDDSRLIETRLDGESLFDGKLLHARRDRVQLPDGTVTTREYIVHPGAVCMIPKLDDGRYVVERQYRYPLQRVFIEFPAGKIDAGEDPLATGKRELLEEAGYTAERWTHLGEIHPVISYSTEVIHIWLAEGLVHVGSKLDAGEFLQIITMSHAEMLNALDRGEITDSKTVAALFFLERHAARPMRAERLTIRGSVQGVGFRYGLITEATAEGLTGWVRNRRDGTVEAHLQGDADAVERVATWARRGPPAAEVTAVERTAVDIDPVHTRFALRSGE
jgi:ADP-ribose pyrophosphatase